MSNYYKTIHEAHDLLKNKEISSVELTKEVFDRIDEVEPDIESFVTITKEHALEQAKVADTRIAGGDMTPITGVPGLMKDIFCTEGIRTTCSSHMLHNFIPPYNATVISKLNDAGMVMVGKANMDEFAMGSSTESSYFHPTRNPWDTNCVPGGSSGGAAAGIAAGEAIFSLGTDTGGSIRQPAAYCGIVGLKPTYGRVSRYGMIAFASSLDQAGPMTRDVTDAAIILNLISGLDEKDGTSCPVPVPDYTKALTGEVKGLKIGVPKEYFVDGISDDVKVAVIKAIKHLEEMGAKVDWDVSLPSTSAALAVYYIIAPCEASANLSRYDGVKYGYVYPDADTMWETMSQTRENGFGAEVKRRIMLGTYALSAGYYDAYYLKAQKVRTIIRQEFDKAFDKYDVLITPTAPTTAFKFGEKINDPVAMYMSDICTIPVNIAGIPGMSIPVGFSNGLPIGMQIIAKSFNEEAIFRTAFAYEQTTEWHKKHPEI
ncbi:MAG: Asp-tRNA(Asn)/Glu-tRNA(Gln) amidotransferase subunit GatA [Dehalococcoidales bacterium]|jgi:aspartyl-tRNA(Asn)/glutamyl-tRNA(Gln) amidotransferase subunit A|nr:Asp-tRNA(Asn)/Glu-tRNA(Gln) amidotransferase subunit GatA [Dehalococcoidales bacterium]